MAKTKFREDTRLPGLAHSEPISATMAGRVDVLMAVTLACLAGMDLAGTSVLHKRGVVQCAGDMSAATGSTR